jgi:hypothetical protein
LWIGKRYRVGKLYLTENFLCFKTLEEVEFTQRFRLVIPWVNVIEIKTEGMKLFSFYNENSLLLVLITFLFIYQKCNRD